MSKVIIQWVETKKQKRQFEEFAWELYKGDPNWIPPLRDTLRELAGFVKHPFYEHNRVQTFLALRDGVVCGRIAAILNHGHNVHYKERRGFFGFFECRDDQEAAHALFDAARYWLAEQGIYNMRGPTNPSLNYELGLLIDGFDSPPKFMMTYNPPYYQKLLDSYGFWKTQDMYAFWGHIDMLPKIGQKLAPVAEQIIERYNVKLRPLDKKHFKQDVEMFLSIYNRSLGNTWGFVPMTPGEVKHTAFGLRFLMVPEMAIAAEMDGKVVGASFALLDYNPRIKEIDGKLFPFGFAHLLGNKKKIKSMRVISTNVLPEYQLFGIGLALMHGFVPMAMEWGIEEAEFSWVLESNSLSYGSLKKGGAQINKTYRLYDYDLDPEHSTTTAKPEYRIPREDDPFEKATRLSFGDQAGIRLPLYSSEKGTAAGRCPPWRVGHEPAVPQDAIEVSEVKNKAELKQFIAFPEQLYREDPHWVSPLHIEVMDFLNRKKHPFYLHGEATTFVARRGGEIVGRILVSDDPRYNQQWGTNVGCFGMFECVEDKTVAHALFNTAGDWLRKRGRTGVLGPIDYSTNYPCGMLIDGFDYPPRIMMNHNPMYYPALWESWGMTKAKDLFAWWFTDTQNLATNWKKKVERIVARGNIVVRAFDQKRFNEEVARCSELYNTAMHDHWGFVKLTEPEFRYMAKQIDKIAQPDQVFVAEVNGRPVGISVTIPDVNEAIRSVGGRLFRWGMPLGAIRAMRGMKKISTARMLILDVLQEYRRRGIAEMLILHTLEHGKKDLGYTGAELGWTLEDNDAVNHTIAAVGGYKYKTYRVYEKTL